MSVTQLATAVGLRVLGLCSLKRDSGKDWSIRISSSWCSASRADIFVVTLICRAEQGRIGYEAFVGSDIAKLLDDACRVVEGQGKATEAAK